MAKIGIIINPHSKRIKRMKTDPVLYYKNIGSEFADVRLTRNSDDIIKAAKDFKKQNISYLAISGGDGSIHLVISKFISVYKNSKLPNILILRDGSMNNIARSYQLKGKGSFLLNKLVNAIRNKNEIRIVYRNTMKVNDMYCFLFGLGFTANFTNEFNKGGNKSPLKAIKVILITALQTLIKKDSGIFERMNLRVIADGKELGFNDFFAIFAATIANLAISFTPTPRAYEKKNAFHLIASGITPGQLLLNFNRIRKGIPVKLPNHYDNVASDLKIICKGKFLYQMDGDIYEANKSLHVTPGPQIGFVSF
ncbi:MAG: diacylglycerol kinase family protein [Spirochaetota bacterium]